MGVPVICWTLHNMVIFFTDHSNATSSRPSPTILFQGRKSCVAGERFSNGCSYDFDSCKVENTLYKLFPSILCDHSQVFADMFRSGAGITGLDSEGENDQAVSYGWPNGEGKKDKCPIVIPELSTTEFDMFVEYHFGR